MRGCRLGRDSTRVESQMGKKEAGARGEGTKQMSRETVSGSKDSLA